ncbi:MULTISPECIES: DUF3007 family protein [unclassified Synechocystis]|uniref:DUF3007 family protein n=1 Tax=unclassified Synechocystis TaxID=2640012 RepID=UPI00040372EE|nr:MULTISPECIES: DUF3007 family protein [unclassified Synechocystis]AIE72620.1 hypothetical protein D082_00910 [Synechocystis sp. PCC 6714]MCT0254711.1 DUF3007 family protein [Synechocystis sp. CS-94]
MRRIDALGIALGFFLLGGLVYVGLQAFGIEGQQAGIWTQAVLVGGLLIWLLSYVTRVFTHDMTYHQQIKEYEDKMIELRWANMTPEEREKLQAEVSEEKQKDALNS